jgi:hypothetical protein
MWVNVRSVVARLDYMFVVVRTDSAGQGCLCARVFRLYACVFMPKFAHAACALEVLHVART